MSSQAIDSFRRKRRATLTSILLAAHLMAAGAALAADTELPASRLWHGELALPQGQRLPLEIELFHNAAGEPDGNLVSPRQGQRYLPLVATQFDGGQLRVRSQSPDIRIEGPIDAEGTWQAEFIQGGFRTALVLQPTTTVSEPSRLQSQDALQRWPGEDIAIRVADAVLGGSLVMPKGNVTAAVLLLGGSGPTQRDGYVAGHRPLAVIAAALAESGVASLRYDKRGVNRSTGQLDIADMATLQADARAALAELRRRIPGVPVFVAGHSEGGMIAAALGAADNAPDGVIALMGPAMPMGELFALQDRSEALAAGASEDEAAALVALGQRVYATAQAHPSPETRMPALAALFDAASEAEKSAFERYNGGTGTLGVGMLRSPHFGALLQADPGKHWRAQKAPALLLFGGSDVQVPASENRAAVDGVPGLDVRLLPGINHLLQDAPSTTGYDEVDHVFAEPVRRALLDWLRQRIAAIGHEQR